MDFLNYTVFLDSSGVIVGGQPIDAEVTATNETIGTADAGVGEGQVQQVQAGGIFGNGMTFWIFVIVVYLVAMYFFAIRPQKKKEKQMQEMQSGLGVGDAVITTTGFYGKVVGVEDEVFIVEFGTNKGVRIPVRKSEVLKAKNANLADGEESK